MPVKKFHTSEANVLKHIIGCTDLLTIVYDPDNTLIKDDDSACVQIKNKQVLTSFILQNQHQKIIVVNASQLPLLTGGIDYIIEFNRNVDYENMQKLSLQFINNPGGSMRWLYPPEIKKPWFLSFYNFNYWKAAIYKRVTKAAFYFGFKKILSNGYLNIYSKNQPLFINHIIKQRQGKEADYAIFTGTAGINRKVIVADASSGQITHFYKIGLNKASAINLRNEQHVLSHFENMDDTNCVLPKSFSINQNTICVSNILPVETIKMNGWTSRHSKFISAIYSAGTQHKRFSESRLKQETGARLQRIARQPRLMSTDAAYDIYNKLHLLYKQMAEKNDAFELAWCHGDFTSWNCYQSAEKIYVYDWELGKSEMPLLYDFFHFVVQGNVFAKNAGTEQIMDEISAGLKNTELSKLIENYQISVPLYFRLYLLFHVSYYLEVYLQQEELHKEGKWLFKAWDNMLQRETKEIAQPPLRKQFIRDLFRRIAQHDYAVLKNAGKPIAELSEESDIDLLIARKDKDALLKWARSFAGIEKMKCISKSFMTTIELFFSDSSYLSIDLLHAFHRKELDYIDARLLLNNIIIEDGIKILPFDYDYLYIFLFYQLNHAGVPDKYSKHFSHLKDYQASRVMQVLYKNTGIKPDNLADTFKYTPEMRRQIVGFLKSKKVNQPVARTKRWLQHKRNIITGFFSNKGFMLTFSGVDGAGKSTILNDVKDMLQGKYRKKVVVIRHRPSMLPILSAWKYGKEAAEKKCVESLPRKGNNKNFISSVMRFSYYYLDYLCGQIIVYCRYILRGYIVLYDRYYFDFIVDSRRSNISINKSFIKNLYRFVYKPQLNIFLFAPPDIILARKRELSAADIIQLTDDYTKLFSRLGEAGQYICIENIDRQKTMNQIEQAIIQLN